MSWLDHKYINVVSSRLSKFKQSSKSVWTFRCPYCGDSEKKKMKRRGYFFPNGDNLFFKCHNCGESKPFKFFLRDNFPEVFKEYIFEEFDGARSARVEKPVERVDPLFMNTGVARFKKNSILENYSNLEDCPVDNPGRLYIEGREIPKQFLKSLYWVEDVNDLFKRIPAYRDRTFRGKFGAVMIPYFSEVESGSTLMYAQLRFIDDDAPGRYMTLEITGGRKVWGLDRIDFTKEIFAFEGAFDAMFIPNAISVGGADILDTVEWLNTKTDAAITIVWDADFSENKELRNRLDEAVKRGFKVALSKKGELHGKDVNDAIKEGGKSSSDVLDIIKRNTFSGLDAQLELATIKKPTKQTHKGRYGCGQKKTKEFPKI